MHARPPCVSPDDPCVSRRHPLPRPPGRLIAPTARCATSAPATTPARRWASLVPLHRRLRRGDARGRRAHTARAPPLRTPTQPLGGLRVHRAVLRGPRGRRRGWGTVGEPAAAALASASVCDMAVFLVGTQQPDSFRTYGVGIRLIKANLP